MATDRYGNTYAMARRLGVMYLIWNHKIWMASSHTWKAYTGSDPHTSHVHISLSWAGALKKTSYWTGKVSGTVAAPTAPKPAPAPAPKPAPAPAPKPAPVPAPTPALPLSGTATVTVPATATGLTTPFLVEAGQHYLLSASGTYSYGAGRTADAECSLVEGSWARHTASEDNRTWTGRDGALDLQVGGQDAHWWPQSGRDCDATHSYRLLVQPDSTGRLRLAVNDISYADNSGSLKVVVTRL